MSEGGEVLARGGFRLDRRRALEKIERFQLEDPRRYVLELMAAALLGGATRFELSQDADDCVLSWDGELPSGEELDALFDHLFGQPEDRRALMLQHLGVGLLGAMGLQPEQVRVDVGDGERAVRLSLDDLADTRHQPLVPPTTGVRCHIREKLSRKLLSRGLLTLLLRGSESDLVQGAAQDYPLPVRVNGVDLPRAEEPQAWAAKHELPGGRLWLVPATLSPRACVRLLRHGLVVHRVEREFGGFRVEGTCKADTLHLNASRSEVVQDERLKAALKALDAAIQDLVADLAVPGGDDDLFAWRGQGPQARHRYAASRAELKAAALPQVARAMAAAGQVPEALRAVLRLTDAFGRLWSPEELQALAQPPGWVETRDADPELPRAQFVQADAPLLKALRSDAVCLDAELKALEEGRVRRAKAPLLPVDFGPGAPLHFFGEGALSGRLTWGPSGARAGVSLVYWGMGGRTIERDEVVTPGLCLTAVLEHPGFGVDPGYTRVQEDDTRRAALARLLTEGERFVRERVAAGGGDGAAAALAFGVLVEHRTRKQLTPDAGASRWEVVVGAELLDAPAFRRASGPLLSLRQVLEGPEPWLVAASAPRGLPPELEARVLELAEPPAKLWKRLLGSRLDLDSDEVEVAIRRARRLAEGVRAPALGLIGHDGFLEVKTPALHGQLGWHLGRTEVAQILLLREGVRVKTCALDLGVPGVVGEIEWPAAPVHRAHDELEPGGEARLAELLRPEADRLAARILAVRAPELPPLLVPWLNSGRVREEPDPALLALPVGRRVRGGAFTLGDLVALRRARKKGDPRLGLLREMPLDLPGFDEAVVVGAAARPVVQAWAGDCVADRDEDAARARTALAQFMQRQALRPTERALAWMPAEGKGWRGELVLPGDPDTVGRLKVVPVWKGRPLTERLRANRAGALLWLEGPGVQPTRNLDAVNDPELMEQALRVAAQGLPKLFALAWERSGPAEHPEHNPAWRGLLAFLTGAASWGKAELLAQLRAAPLFPVLHHPPVSVDQLVAAADKPWVLVAPNTELGPLPHAHHLLDERGVSAALAAALGRELPPGDDALQRWRVLQRKRVGRTRLEARLTGPQRARAPLGLPGVEGEVGLGSGAPELLLTPLVEGVPLEPIRRLFPAPVQAIAQGEGIQADRAVERALDTPGLKQVLEAAEQAAHAMLRAFALEPKSEADRALARGWVLGALEPGDAAQAPLFELADGGRASLQDLLDRQARDGGVGVLSTRGRGLPGVPPLVASGDLRVALGQRLRLVELDARVADAQWSGASSAQVGRVYELAAHPERDEVEVRLGGLALTRVASGGPVPLWGWVHDPGLVPRALWDGVEPGPAWDALLAWLRARSEQELEERLQRASPEDLQLLRGALRRLAPDTQALTEALASTEGPAAALARAPLFRTSEDRPCSLKQLRALSRVRAVAPQSQGAPAPGALPFIRLEAAERAWLAQVRPVDDAQEALRVEWAGVQRRQGPQAPRPTPPFGSASRELDQDGLQAHLWLERPGRSTLSLRVGGVEVERAAAPVPGLCGWVDGALEVDVGFSRVTLSEAQRALVWSAARALWMDEATTPAGATLALYRAHALVPTLPALLDAHPDLEELAPLRTPAGRPLSLGALREHTRRRDALYVSPQAPRSPELDAAPMVLVLDGMLVGLMLEFLPSGRLVEAAAAQRRAQEREAERGAAAAKKRAAKDVAAVRAAVNQLAKDLRHPALVQAAEPCLKRWEAEGLPPAFHPHAVEGRVVWLAAWEACFGVHAAGPTKPKLELRALVALARRLR